MIILKDINCLILLVSFNFKGRLVIYSFMVTYRCCKIYMSDKIAENRKQ